MSSLLPLLRHAWLAPLSLLWVVPSAPACAAPHDLVRSDDWGFWQGVAGAILIVSVALLGFRLARERAGRRRAERSLGERLRFETLLSEQVATFSRVSGADIDRAIQRALRRIADFLSVDWGNLTEYSDDSQTARVTHWWAVEGVEPQPSAIGFEEIPWVVTRLRRGELVRFSKTEELPSGVTVASIVAETSFPHAARQTAAHPKTMVRTGEMYMFGGIGPQQSSARLQPTRRRSGRIAVVSGGV